MRPFGDGRIFVEVGDAMVNVDAIVAYVNQPLRSSQWSEDPHEVNLFVITATHSYEERGVTVEQFTERLKGVVTGD